MSETDKRSGSCLCGSVRFEVSVPDPRLGVCHCGMCRRWSAGPFFAVHSPEAATFQQEGELSWYQASPWAERGFCRKCGSSLFYRLVEQRDGMVIVSAEALDDTSGLALGQHIYLDSKPGYYEFADDCPRLTEQEFLAAMGVAPDGDASS